MPELYILIFIIIKEWAFYNLGINWNLNLYYLLFQRRN